MMWKNVLKDKRLSREQELVVKHFEEAPKSRHFYPMAKLLKDFGFKDEATEMLMVGVSEHPHFTVARVLLVNELWSKGLFVLAWKILQDPNCGSIEDNVLAYTLKFKLSVVLGYEADARTALAHLQEFLTLDSTTVELVKQYSLSGMTATRTTLLSIFDPSSIELPSSYDGLYDLESGDAHHTSYNDNGDSSLSVPKITAEFHAVPLRDVFAADGDPSHMWDGKKMGVELDSLTLAEIFEKQHCYSKALEVYKRLSASAPGHDGLRKKILLLERKCKEQELSHFTDVDDLISTLEDKELMDRKQQFLKGMLENVVSLGERSNFSNQDHSVSTSLSADASS
ncbi:MAG: hypothetical protein OXC44_07505 [Proteobacteria bacterium]|nr:hypothetical protein [Pseudomonadota bacterium]